MSSNAPRNSVQIIPHGQSLIQALAKNILAAKPADAHMNDVAIIVPDLGIASRLREALLQQATIQTALLYPPLQTLQQFAENQAPTELTILNNHARELMLVEVVRGTNALKGSGNAWQLADELLKLFDELELSEHNVENLPQTFDALGLDYFSEDSAKVVLLWQARVAQMLEEGSTDRIRLYREGLTKLMGTDSAPSVIVAGYDWFSAHEMKWLNAMLAQNRAIVLVNADTPLARALQPATQAGATPEDRFLSEVFAREPTLKARAQRFNGLQSPLNTRLKLLAAENTETEANCIELQVRQWLLEGFTRIGIVTENRQLARRVSALINHRGLTTQDEAGWPLSTTSAAGALEHWLRSIESDFEYRSLLDVLKSRFMRNPEIGSDEIFHFERDIIEHEGIPNSAHRYRDAIINRASRLDQISPSYSQRLLTMLDQIEQAAEPLVRLKTENRYQLPHRYLQALQKSLTLLGLEEGYAADPAGQRILQELEDMAQSEAGRDIRFNWTEFRSWLSRALETHNFRPARQESLVTILSLKQSTLSDFDGLILAGLDSRQLPKPPARLVFFNDPVKQQLGLGNSEITTQRQFAQFRRLLQAANKVMLSYSREDGGTPQLPSPWVARLQTMHTEAFGQAIDAPKLLSSNAWQSANRFPPRAPYPNAPAAPFPSMTPVLFPEKVSAASHQKLIHCPYAWYASYGLSLRASEEIIDKLERRDFGNGVHLCLQAFHSDVASLSGPFREALTAESRDKAEALLHTLGNEVFKPDEHESIEHKQWMEEWLRLVPNYIDWEIQRQREWTLLQAEQEAVVCLDNGVSVFGKIDRLDNGPAGLSVVDYKTGNSQGKLKEIEAGEDVQITTYAIIKPESVSVSYLKLSANEGLSMTTLEGDSLRETRDAVRQRLDRMLREITTGGALAANGIDQQCGYCRFAGLCRKEMWQQ